MAFLQKNLIARATHPQRTVTLDTHSNDEAVVLQKIAMETVVEFQHADTEIGGIDNEHCPIIKLDRKSVV